MKKVIDKNSCEICGQIFDAEYIEHETKEEDYPFEIDIEELIYPHKHYQPTVSCMICPDCRQ